MIVIIVAYTIKRKKKNTEMMDETKKMKMKRNNKKCKWNIVKFQTYLIWISGKEKQVFKNPKNEGY